MQAESRFGLITRLQDAIHECLKEHITDAPLALVDFPDIRNVGDSAIWLGEIAYLKARFAKKPSYVSIISNYSDQDLEKVVPEGPIFIHGGGNFGDIWPSHQKFRERIIDRWPNRPIIQFPQSIHYSAPERAVEVARAIAKHRNFTLLVRDEESRHFAEKHFDCTVKLCPDMAFCIGAVEPGSPQYPVLAMLREDKEKSGSHDLSRYPDMPVEDWITESRLGIKAVKALARIKAAATFQFDRRRAIKFDDAANARLRRGTRQLSRGQAIITDRLHVHIVSILLGRPHAVLDNFYGKVGRFMSAFSGGTDLSFRASSFDEAHDWAMSQASAGKG